MLANVRRFWGIIRKIESSERGDGEKGMEERSNNMMNTKRRNPNNNEPRVCDLYCFGGAAGKKLTLWVKF